MHSAKSQTLYICSKCLQARARARRSPFVTQHVVAARKYSNKVINTKEPQTGDNTKEAISTGHTARISSDEIPEKGALSRRLEQLSEEALETGGKAAQRAVEEAGFDEGLRKELEERIARANFRNDYASAIAQANLPESAGRATRDLAGAKPWTGTEALEDTALRMLKDAHKPLRVPAARGPSVRTPSRVDTGRPSKGSSSGQRVVNARDRSSYYSFMKDSGMDEKEKEQLRKQLKARFEPAARSLPASIQGLTSLANERIEDAIARGQFKNLPRGMKIERDYNASSPFIDTTEYLLNKIIQKQEIVPPWIEKQQELVSTANKFRARLRNDWKRHAARSISSRGGGLDAHVRRAKEFAAAELIFNPAPKQTVVKEEDLQSDHASQISLAGELVLESTSDVASVEGQVSEPVPNEPSLRSESAGLHPPSQQVEDSSTYEKFSLMPGLAPFRDPQWLAAEQSYLAHSINHLNSLTRSYNLMAPDLAKKPYFALDRELAAMYRDVAPQLPIEILERAKAPAKTAAALTGGGARGVLAGLGAGEKARVYDESKTKHYGLKEFWRDLFG